MKHLRKKSKPKQFHRNLMSFPYVYINEKTLLCYFFALWGLQQSASEIKVGCSQDYKTYMGVCNLDSVPLEYVLFQT